MLADGRSWTDLAELDRALCELDGSADKSVLGANAIVGVSMAAARAFAAEQGRELYLSLDGPLPRLPVPHFNVINGGAHASNALDFQEFMIAPVGAPTFAEALRGGAEIYQALRRRLGDQGLSTGLGDEGGFAPELGDAFAVCQLLVDAVTDAGYSTGQDGVMIALDPAANSFYFPDGRYGVAGESLTGPEMVERYVELVSRYPIWSIEDGCAEDDRDSWRRLTDALGEKIQIVGDDLFVTDAERIVAASKEGIANAALIKVNQIGTVTETLDALALCRSLRYGAMVSHRSGETRDSFIADLAVASGCGQIKAGAPARGERVAKYNRLLEIESVISAVSYGLPAAARPAAW
jgi:enolase